MKESHRIRVYDGEFEAIVVRSRRPNAPAVLVLHETFDVDAGVRDTCDELSRSGFLVVCPDLFWRHGSPVDRCGGNQADRDAAPVKHLAFDLEHGVNDITAAIWCVRGMLPAGGRVGVMGFGLGGLLAYRAAACSSADAAVAFYARGMQTYLDEARSLRAPLLIHLALEDNLVTPNDRRSILEVLGDRSGVECHVYPGCGHAFAHRGNLNHQPAEGRLAMRRSLAFLHRHLD